MKLKKIAALLSIAGFAAPAFATNGMNMEGYGPISTAMGGTSMAYDNGTAGLINNPATLGLMKSGTSRLDLAIGGLHPDVTASVPAFGMNAPSKGTAYYMPAVGYVRKDGAVTWGAGMMSQGGMGTEYGKTSFMSVGTGRDTRSELGVGRVIFPLVFDVSDSFRIGGSADYVWGGLDMAMGIDATTFGGMAANTNGTNCNNNKNLPGYACNFTGGFGGLGAMLGQNVTHAYLSANKGDGKFSQELTTSGFAGNLGFAWAPTKDLSIGAVYHARTTLKDMTGNATLSTVTLATGATAASFSGKMTVKNFQWPETYGIGVSYKANDKLMLALDYKNIAWSQVMKAFNIQFRAAAGGLDMGFNQNWKDQNIVQLGASYKMDDSVTLRAGASFANSPITSNTTTGVMHPLFPATPTDHYTLGAGFAVSKMASVDVSMSHAPSVSTFNQSGIKVTHSQTNWQAMFSQRF